MRLNQITADGSYLGKPVTLILTRSQGELGYRIVLQEGIHSGRILLKHGQAHVTQQLCRLIKGANLDDGSLQQGMYYVGDERHFDVLELVSLFY